jgi:nitroimidazol reductase NimA-like FMN-containing flavoprotein (pyridoxamine 5'-phosphate oxidase superfamily)
MKVTQRNRLHRLPARGSHESGIIHSILDAAFLAHVGFQAHGQPFVIPTLYGRDGNTLYLHGSVASRMLKELGGGIQACVAVTVVDGLVLARSAFHHSMNYRSVVAFGTARPITERDRKVHALRVISDHLIAGRWDDVRAPNDKELKGTAVLEFALDEASAKIRSGPPKDEPKDYARTVWAGVIPLVMEPRSAIPDERLADGTHEPQYELPWRNESAATPSLMPSSAESKSA